MRASTGVQRSEVLLHRQQGLRRHRAGGRAGGHEHHVFAIVPSNQPGLTFHDDWDNIGQRLTESGSVTITEVQVPWSDAAHYTRTRTRPWLHGGHNKAVDEPYILDTYSDLAAKLWAVEALADQVDDEA